MAEAALQVIAARMAAASDADEARGVLGFVRVELRGGFLLDGLTVRRRASDGQLYLGFPARTSATGERYTILQPRDDATRRAFEREVFEAIGIGSGGSR